MDAADLDRTLSRMARQIAEYFEDVNPSEMTQLATRFGLVGLQTRGVYLARRLAKKLASFEQIDLPIGILDVTLYRDDVHRRMHPVVRPTHIPFSVDERHLIVVDDVCFTGRTARAALDALTDLGRPASVRLAILIDRGHRELPICPDLVGREIVTTLGEEIRVRLQEVDEEEGVWLVEPKNIEPTHYV